jgi:hypothetical protein
VEWGETLAKIEWDTVSSFIEGVSSTDKTITFPKVQDYVKVTNKGNVNVIYTIGTQTGTLSPNDIVEVRENISSLTVRASSGTSEVYVRASEAGTEKEETATDVTSQLNELSSSLAQSMKNTYYPAKYGAKFDGLTDDTDALNAMFADISKTNGGIVVLPGGTALIRNATEGSHTFLLEINNLTIIGNNTVFKVKDNEPLRNSARIFTFRNCQNVTVSDITVDGNRANRTANTSTLVNININIDSDGKNLVFQNVKSINALLDGWYIRSALIKDVKANYPTDIKFINCTGNNCFRQGMSIISAVRVKIIRCEFNYTNGAALGPCLGIDLEPNSTDIHGTDDILILDSECSYNAGGSVGMLGNSTGRCNNTRIINHLAVGNGTDGIRISNSDNLYVKGLVIKDHISATLIRGVIDLVGSNNNTIIEDVYAENVIQDATKFLIYVHSNANIGVVLRNIRGKRLPYGISTASPVGIDGIDFEDLVGMGISFSAAHVGSQARNIKIKKSTNRNINFNTVNGILENVYCEETNGNTACVEIPSTATGAKVSNVTIKKGASTLSPYGFRVASQPSRLIGVVIEDYTTSWSRDSAGFTNVTGAGIGMNNPAIA